MAEAPSTTLPIPESLPARPLSAEPKPLNAEDSTSMIGAIEPSSQPAAVDEASASKVPAEPG
jgi:hypothetical protein